MQWVSMRAGKQLSKLREKLVYHAREDRRARAMERHGGPVSNRMTHQESATFSKAFGVQGLLPNSRKSVQDHGREKICLSRADGAFYT
jgi:hypothetical protein